MKMKGYRWSVEVTGGNQIATLLARHFPALATELDAEGRLFIAHPDIEIASTASEARETAEGVLKTLLPPIAVVAPYLPECGLGPTVREHDRDGNVLRQNAFISGHCSIMVMASGIATIGGSNAAPAPPPRTNAERAAALSATNADFCEASLRLYKAGDDIRQLYVVYEYVRDHICGSPKNWQELARRGWATEAELQAFRDTANDVYRHKPKPLQDEMSPASARELIRRLLGHWVNHEMPT